MRPFVSCHCLILKKASGAHRHYLDGIFCLLTQTDSVTAPAWKVPLPSSRLDSRRQRSPPSPLPRWACGGFQRGPVRSHTSIPHTHTHTHTIRALCPPFHTWPFSPPPTQAVMSSFQHRPVVSIITPEAARVRRACFAPYKDSVAGRASHLL